MKPRGTYRGKRLLDLAISIPVLVAAAPLMAAIGCVVRLKMGSPVVFRQLRPGFREQPFEMFKFRTMNDKRDADGELLPDGERLTTLGSFMRRTSLDELPELINVFRGQMSIVGPRPLRMEYLPYYTERERMRHSVLPGITGLAQVSGRNLIDWDKRLELDAQYAENVSLLLDLKILFKSVAVVLAAEGAAPDSASVGEARIDYLRSGNRDPKAA